VCSVLTLGAFRQQRVIKSSFRPVRGTAPLEAAGGPRYTAPMKLLRVISLGFALLPALACAQWQWIDKDGRKVFSDRSPPTDIPAKNILKQPGGKPLPVPAEAEAPADVAATGGAPVTKTVANVPKISGKDPALEEKKKAAEQEELAKKKVAEEKFAKEKADNCERARKSLQVFTNGQRVRTTNAKGESEYLTDEQRAAETKRLQAITADCKG
jgi:Domain of unknown function (DUF4124)